MSTQTFVFEQSDLASRRAASAVRQSVDVALSTATGPVTIDFSNVLSLSESYADELFGVLIELHSLEWVFSRIQIAGARKAVLNTIAAALKYRLVHRIASSASDAERTVSSAVEARNRALAHAF